MSVKNFFRQRDQISCGLCVVNTILSMYGLPGVIFRVSPINGTSVKRITSELSRSGLDTEPKNISICHLKPRSILWYPPRGNLKKRGDHYVVVGKITAHKAFIYDSSREAPYWEKLSVLRKKWYRLYHGRWCGWVIETKRK